jgi:hypothetical protein
MRVHVKPFARSRVNSSRTLFALAAEGAEGASIIQADSVGERQLSADSAAGGPAYVKPTE